MADDLDKSLGDAATYAGGVKRSTSSREVSIGDEHTLAGDLAIDETLLGDIEIVDLEARYTVEAGLGAGGMGAVVLATDTRLGRKVAIKRILGEAARSKSAIARFLTEARAIAAISHPNVVQIYELGVAKSGPFLVIEYIDGGSLLDRCKSGPMAADEAVSVVCQVCDGLAKAHDAGIIHRDIKPANILLTKDGIAKLTDFGLAKAEAADHQMTMTGAVMGTPDFMPPEQRRDAAIVDHRSDLWSLAATLYQMVSGRSPKVIRLHELPQDLQPIIAKALEDEKDARYQSAKEFCDTLKGIGTGSRSQKAPAQFEGVLQEGQCKACGTVTSDLTKKFCRNPQCGAGLRVPCLKCDTQIPVWDGVCGECGGNQPALLEQKRKVLAAQCAEAEARLAACAFDEAASLAEQLSATGDERFAEMAEWGRDFVVRVASERSQHMALAAAHLEDARKHRAACDWSAAIRALEAIPGPLLVGEAAELLADCLACRDEASRLIEEIRERVSRREIEGLLPIVVRARSLRSDREDLAKIQAQLEQREMAIRANHARQRVAAADAYAAAMIRFHDQGNAVGAIAALEPHERILSPMEREQLAVFREAAAAEKKLAEIVTAAKTDNVIEPAEVVTIALALTKCLSLMPGGSRTIALRDQLLAKIRKDPGAYVPRLAELSPFFDLLDEVARNSLPPALAAILEKPCPACGCTFPVAHLAWHQQNNCPGHWYLSPDEHEERGCVELSDLDGESNVPQDGQSRRIDRIRAVFTSGEVATLREKRVFLAPNIPHDKLHGALAKYAPSVAPGEVLLLYDNTVWGSAGDGLLLTGDRVYWHNLSSSPESAWFGDIRSLSVAKTDFFGACGILIDGKKIDIQMANTISRSQLANVLHDVIARCVQIATTSP